MLHYSVGKKQVSLITSSNLCQAVEETLGKAASADLTPVFIIVPDRFTLQAERILLSKKSCLFNVRVVTFSVLFNILQEESGTEVRVLDKTSAVLFMWQAIQQVKNDLIWFSSSAGHYAFAEKMFNTVNQLSSSMVDFDKLETSAKEGITRKKMHDIALIRSTYKKLIAEYTDSSGVLGWLLDNIRHSAIIKNTKVFITGFQHLSIQRGAVVAELIKHAGEFVAGYQKSSEFEQLMAELLISAKCQHIDTEAKKTDVGEVRNFETNQDEAVWVANEICMLVKMNGVRYRDIVVVADDPAILHQVFTQNGIAVNVDVGANLLQTPVTQFLKEYLLLAATNGQIHYVNIIKNLCSGLETNEEFTTENKALKNGIRGDESTAIFVKQLQKCKTVKEFCIVLAHIADMGSNNIVRRKLLELLETVGTALANQKITILEFINMFVALASATKFSDIPTFADAVLIVAATEYQPSFMPYVFVTGANDGAFPSQQEDTDIITVMDIANLSVHVEPSANLQNARNRRHAADIMTSATAKFYASFIGTAQSGLIEKMKPAKNEAEIASKTIAMHTVLKAIGDGTAFEDMRYHGAVLKSLDLGDLEYLNPNKRMSELKAAEQLFFQAGKVSVTQIENFRKCPYYHFLENGLRVRVRERNKIAANILGTIIHKLAEEFTLAIIKVGRKGLEGFDADEEMKKVIERVLYIEEFRAITADYKNAPVISNLKKEARVMANDIVRQIKESKYFPAFVEMPMQGEIDGVTVLGQADRVDITLDNHVNIIDYKTGSIDKESLQLPLYKEFLPCKYIADGAYFFSLKPGNLKIQEAKQADAVKIASEVLIKIRNGAIVQKPKDTKVCRYCAAFGMCQGGSDEQE